MQIPLVFSPKRAYIRDVYKFRLALTDICTAATQYQSHNTAANPAQRAECLFGKGVRTEASYWPKFAGGFF